MKCVKTFLRGFDTIPRFAIKFVVLSLACVFILAATPNDLSTAPVEQPRLYVAERTHNFGTVHEGEVVQHSFSLRNDGDDVLELRRVRTDCGCTVASISPQKVKPGENATVHALFDTKGFFGKKVKTIRLFTNDPKNSSVLFQLEGEVLREVNVSPSRLFFGSVQKGTTPTLQARVDTQEGVKVLSASARSPLFTVTLAEKGKVIRVTLSDSIPVGNFRSRVILKTTSARNPIIPVPVLAKVSGDIALEPSDISFGLHHGPLARPIEKRVRLFNRSKQPISLLSLRADNSDILVSSSEVREGREFLISVSIKEGAVGAVRGRIKIETGHPDEEQSIVYLPVYAVISPD